MQIAVLLMLSNFFFWPGPMDWQMNQQNVVIRGVVVDRTGRTVAGADVSATSPGVGAHTVSDGSGQFIFLTLFPGTYVLCASKGPSDNVDCRSRDADVPELFAGFEYGATIELSSPTN